MTESTPAAENTGAWYALFYTEGLYRVKNESQLADAADNRPRHPEPEPAAPAEGAKVEPLPVSSGDGNALPLLGLANAGTLILFENEPTGEELVFLKNVLKATRNTLETVARLQTQSLPPGIAWADLAEQVPADIILAFGAPAQLLPEGIGLGEIYTMDGKRVYNGEPLEAISANLNKKKILWTALQELYNL